MIKRRKKMLINKLLSCLDDGEYLKIGIFGKNEVAVYVGDREIPISVFIWDDGSHCVRLDVEGYDWVLTTKMIVDLGVIMSVLEDEAALAEIRSWVEDIE
jgi:hypothetical protein